MASPSNSTPDDGWKIVTRRRRPAHFLPSSTPRPQSAKVLSPNPLSYAQVLQKSPPPRTNVIGMATQNSTVPNLGLQPVTDINPQHSVQPMYAKSPHSPTMLRYPPNPNYKEWWGRCFRCTRKGHIVPDCQFPRWHPNPKPAPPAPAAPRLDAQPVNTGPNIMAADALGVVHHTRQPSPIARDEPSFEELLADPEPSGDPEMPANRPLKVQCYFNRDRQYSQHLERMLSGVVVQPPDHLLDSISLDQVAAVIASSKRVSVEQLQVAILAKDKFIVLLPPNLKRDEVMAAIPTGVWDHGYKLLSYSPLLLTDISIPMFRLWIDVIGVPLELCHEGHMARAISSFGCYLGFMEPRTYGDCRTWSIFLATDDLTMVPEQLEFRIGGLVYSAIVRPRRWLRGQVYQRSDLPPSPITYQPPPSKFTNPQLALKEPSIPDPAWFQGDDVMHMSLKALREIFRDFDPSELPPDLVECLAGNEAAIKANNEAGKMWEQQNRQTSAAAMETDENLAITQDPRQDPAIVDPHQTADLPGRSHLPRSDVLRPSSHAPLAGVAAPTPPGKATVHRTESHTSRGKRPQADLALQVCSPHPFVSLGDDVHPWEARDLFPEIGTPPTHHLNQTMPKKTNQKPKPKTKKTVPSLRPRRTSNRIARKKGGDGSILNIDVQNFVDVPLQHTEGLELLTLIGAGNIPIPSQLMISPQQKEVNFEMGQSSHAPVKKKKQDGPMFLPSPSSVHEAHHTESPLALTQLSGRTLEEGGLSTPMNDGLPGSMDDPKDVDEPTDDPYLDRVDYSDDDPLF